MSRCFSFSPPDYVWNGISGDILVDLLKNIREKKKNGIDDRRKKRTREEKAKKRGQYKRKMQKHKEISDDAKKKSEDDEKSDLTEEHARPNSIGSLCYTSDGATRSNRKRDDDDLPNNANNSKGQAALILLFKECFALATRNCTYLNGYHHSIGQEHDCAEFEVSQLSDQEMRGTKTMSEEVAMYRALMETLTIPLQYEPVDDDDQKWLFEKRSNDDDAALKRLKTTSNNCSFGYSLNEGPRAQYIKEADIYALPYTIPF